MHRKTGNLRKFSSVISNFYGLPKIHKFALIQEATAEQNHEYVKLLGFIDPKLEPIVI